MPANGFNTQTQALSGQGLQVALPDGVASYSAPVTTTATTLAITAASHAGKVIVQNAVTGCLMTLPNATGSGAVYTIVVGASITSVGLVVKVARAADHIYGNQFSISDGSAAVLGYVASAGTDDTITFDGSTTGGYVGDQIVLKDIAANYWQALVHNKATGTEASCFSNTVS